MRRIFLNKKNISDERIESKIYKYGYETSMILLVLLFIDCLYKIIMNRNDFISSILIFIVGLIYINIRIIRGGVLLAAAKLSENKKFIKVYAIKVSLMGALSGVGFDILIGKSISRMIFSFIFWFIACYGIVLTLYKIGVVNDNKRNESSIE